MTTPNQQTWSTAISLHGDYHFNTAWTVGASYLYSNPLNGCVSAPSHQSPPCGKVKPPQLNPDDSIPGFELSTLYEAYVAYKDSQFYAKAGDQVINLAWAPAADSRLKPASYEGIDAIYSPNKEWSFEGTDMFRFEPRTSSQFYNTTLLTSFPAGYGGVASNIYVPGGTYIATNGFFLGRAAYASQSATKATASLNYYAFLDIANALWLDAHVPLAGTMHPFVNAHVGTEKNAGSSVIGKIDSSIFGLQAGASIAQNVVLAAGFTYIPLKTDTIALPAGYSCASNHTIKGTANSANGVSLPYLLPSGGTGQCTPASNGLTNIYYGGWASPYTDSSTSDPLFTTSLTQGMIERRSPGTAFKATLTFTSDDKQFVSYISRGWYDYNNPAYAQGTYENDFDALYYFSKIPPRGGYRGFSFHYRYGERVQSGNANIGGLPLFKYNRFQAEYSF